MGYCRYDDYVGVVVLCEAIFLIWNTVILSSRTYTNSSVKENDMVTEQLALVDLIDDMCAGNDVVLKPIRFARDIMTKEVRTLTLDHSVNACIKLMKA